MNIQTVQWCYRNLLVKSGIQELKAEMASQNLSHDDFRIISEIWPEWGLVYRTNHDE